MQAEPPGSRVVVGRAGGKPPSRAARGGRLASRAFRDADTGHIPSESLAQGCSRDVPRPNPQPEKTAPPRNLGFLSQLPLRMQDPGRAQSLGRPCGAMRGKGQPSSGTWMRGLDEAERGAAAPVFTRSGAGPVHTPEGPLVTSPPGAAVSLTVQVHWEAGGRALGWESGTRSSGSGLAHTSSGAVSSASLGLDSLPEGGSLELVDTQGSPSPDISQALDIDFLPPRGQS